jgi:uncharacterized membrane protein YfcA
MANELAVVAVGLLAGVIAGMLGVGGGALFAPALVLFLGESQLHAEATALVAIVPTALAGAWSQQRYGNLRLREGVTLGLLGIGGAFAGVAIANAVSERVLRITFAVFLLAVAFQMVRRELRPDVDESRRRGELV